MNNNIVNFPGYYQSEMIEGGHFPTTEGYVKNIKIINNLDYAIYVHSIFPVVKIDPNTRNEMGFINKEVLIFCKSITSTGKENMLRISIPQEELDKRMVFVKELNILICTLEDYISDNENRDNRFLTKEINSIDKYMVKAIENRINNFGDIPIFFNFNDPSNEYKKVFLYIFGSICEIKIDNNHLEDYVAQIIIKGTNNEQTKYIHLDPNKIFKEQKAIHQTVGDIDILCCVDYESLKRAIIKYKTNENKMISYEFLVEKEKEIESKFQMELDLKDSKIRELESKLEITNTNHENETNKLNNEIIKLKAELEKSYMLLDAEIKVSERIDRISELGHKERMRKLTAMSMENKLNKEIKIANLGIKHSRDKHKFELEKMDKELELTVAKKEAELAIARSKERKEGISLLSSFMKLML